MTDTLLATLRGTLKTVIDAQLSTDGVSGVAVSEFPIGDETAQTDAVFVGTIRSERRRITQGGTGGSIQEELTADLFVYCIQPGAGDTDAATAEDRAITIFGSIESTIRTDPTLGSVFFDSFVGSFESKPEVTTEGRVTILGTTVTATAIF